MLKVIDRGYIDHKGRTVVGKMPIGNQGDKGTYFVDYECFFGSDLSYTISITTTNGSSSLMLNGASWEDFGIASGDSIVFTALDVAGGGSTAFGTSTVAIVNGNELILTADWTATAMYISGSFHVNKAPESVKTFFNLIPNDEQSGITSLIDGSTLSIYNNNISSMSVSDVEQMSEGGDLSGSGFDSASIERLADRKGGLAKSYRIKVNFTWWLYLNNFSSLFDANLCVTPYVFSEFMPTWNNPAVSLSVGFKLENDGNSGFRDENFNQNTNRFTVDSVKFSIGSQIVNGIDYTKPTDFEIKVQNLTGTGFSSELGLIIFNDIQDPDVYSASNSNNNGNFSHLAHTIFTEKADILTDGTVQTFTSPHIESLTISVKIVITGFTATYSGTITPNAAFTAKFLDQNNVNRTFAILPRLESATIPASNYSDTVNLLVWRDEVFAYPPILGSYFGTARVYDHSDNLI